MANPNRYERTIFHHFMNINELVNRMCLYLVRKSLLLFRESGTCAFDIKMKLNYAHTFRQNGDTVAARFNFSTYHVH